MNFTGERYIPGKAFGEIETEHMHRYLSLADVVKGKVVLDAACGEGYGTYILSNSAYQVYGIDISKDSIEYAKNKYRKGNIEYTQSSIGKLNFEDNSIDVVVSFETIEHVHEDIQELFLNEVKRVLKKDGVLIISTPDRHVYSDKSNYYNHYHVKEFYFYEFSDFLKKHFGNVSYYYQDIGLFGVIGSYNTKQNNKMKNIDIQDTAVEGKYIIAACSNGFAPNTDSILSIYKHNQKETSGSAALSNDILQVFWDENELFCEQNSISVPYEILDEFQNIEVNLPDVAKGRLRIDVGNAVALIQIRNITINLKESTSIDTRYSNLAITKFYNMINIVEDNNSMSLLSLNNDPHIVLDNYLEKSDHVVQLCIELRVTPLTISDALPILKEKYNANLNELLEKKEVLIKKEEELEGQSRELEIKGKKIEEQNEELLIREKKIEEQNEELLIKGKKIEELNEELEIKGKKIREQHEELAIREKKIAEQNEELDMKEKKIKEQCDETTLNITRIVDLNGDVTRLQNMVEQLENELVSIKDSLSWRGTKPLRQIKHIVLTGFRKKPNS